MDYSEECWKAVFYIVFLLNFEWILIYSIVENINYTFC